MKRISILVSLIIIGSVSACPRECDLSKVQWAPTMEDVMDEPDIKMLVFFRDDPMRLGSGVERFEEIGRLVDKEKIETVVESIEEDSTPCECEDQCAHMYAWPTWMGVVNRKNQGLLINLGWNHTEERVEFISCYSVRLYDMLVEYGIIKPPKKNMFVNNPNIVHFEAPPQNHLQKKTKVITAFRERDLDQFYIEVDPNTTPVYVQVDPNLPAVYIAVDPNLAHVYLRKLLPGINIMKEKSEELMAQNRWFKDTLDGCLKKLEEEEGLPPMVSEPNDYVNRWKPTEPEILPYTKPQIKPFPETPDIHKLSVLINLHCLATDMFIYSTRENIRRFEQRMERLENYQEK